MKTMCNIIRENDEKVCTVCNKRWGIDEESPTMCVNKRWVHRPMRKGNKWAVKVTADASPFSDTIEEIVCETKNAAWDAYRFVMKQKGLML